MGAAHFLSLFRPTLIWVPHMLMYLLLIVIDYLYLQTGKCMQDMDPEGEETEQLLEDLGDEAEDEGFTDDTEASLEVFSALISIQGPNSRVSPCWARVWTCLPPRLWPPGS